MLSIRLTLRSGSEGTSQLAEAVFSLVTSGGVQAAIGKRRRTGEAPHEVFISTLVVSSGLVGDGYRDRRGVLGCRYGLPRKSVGSRHDGLSPPSLVGFWSGDLY